MRLDYLTATFCTLSAAIAAPPVQRDPASLSLHDAPSAALNELEKRRGGGGGGGRGGGGGGGGRSGSSGSGGRTGSSGSGSGNRASGRTYSYDANSNAGGRTRDGSGTLPKFGNRYPGGATVPYPASGARSRSLVPFALLPIAVLPGLWFASAYAYSYPIGYRYRNNGQERNCNVTCLCAETAVCGCEPTDNSTFLQEVLTNGSTTNGPPVNSSDATTVIYPNGTCLSYINGTLENGTTAAGGTDPSNDDQISPAVKLAINYGGYWMMAATVVASLTII